MHPALSDLADRLQSVTTDLHALAPPARETGRGSDSAAVGAGPSLPDTSDSAASPSSAVATTTCQPGTGATTRLQLADWVALVALGQHAINQLTAFLDTAMVRVAAHESCADEDGQLVETDHGDGHVALDAADLIAGPLGLSHVGAGRRLEQAVRLVTDRCPITAEPSGLGGIRAAMTAGALDGWRAQVVTDELTGAPAPVAQAVIAALADTLPTRAAGALRKRVRTVLARISPDLLRERAEAARRDCGLRRSVGEPGTDCWWAVFPSEQAATAWAVVDALAQRLVRDAQQPLTIDAARGQALLDLIGGRATIDVHVQLTVPAETLLPDPPPSTLTPGRPDTRACTANGPESAQVTAVDDGGEALVQVSFGRPEPALVAREWVTNTLLAHGYRLRQCHPSTGALHDEGSSPGYRPGADLAALVRARDGRCRFPGCSINARFCDLDHVIPWPLGPTTAANLATLCRRHHRIKQRPGWHVTLHADATMTWIDPTGQARDSYPIDHLRGLTLPSRTVGVQPNRHHHAPTDPASATLAKSAAKRRAFSRLEFELEHAINAAWHRPTPADPASPTTRPTSPAGNTNTVAQQPPSDRRREPAASGAHPRRPGQSKTPPRHRPHLRRQDSDTDIVHIQAWQRDLLVSFKAPPRSRHPDDPRPGAGHRDEAPPY